MQRWILLLLLAACVPVCGCKSLTGEDKDRRNARLQEKANQDMMRIPNGEESPFGS